MHCLPISFCHFLNTTAQRLRRCKHSFPYTKVPHGCTIIFKVNILYYLPLLHKLFYWAIPGLFLFIFDIFQTNITTNITTNKQTNKHYNNLYNKLMWKICPYSLMCRYSNYQPSDFESHPITTRPGIPAYIWHLNLGITEHLLTLKVTL